MRVVVTASSTDDGPGSQARLVSIIGPNSRVSAVTATGPPPILQPALSSSWPLTMRIEAVTPAGTLETVSPSRIESSTHWVPGERLVGARDLAIQERQADLRRCRA